MSFNEDYAKLYDALYHDKDYAQEGHFVEGLLIKHATAPIGRILDFGCGTGRHDIALVQRGYTVHGIDVSADMLTRAGSLRTALPSSLQDRLTFQLGDIRTLDTSQVYDAVVALFHVMSYQTTDADVVAVLKTARRHLVPGGLFLFDFWHGPAIASEGPANREKRVKNDQFSAVRYTRPVWDKARDTVRVVYDLEITEMATGQVQLAHEEHLMRYFFRDRLVTFANESGFKVLEEGEWLTGLPPRAETFGVYMMLQAS